MNGIALTLRALHHGEERLAHELVTVADRHRTEHEVRHVALDLAQWSREHVRRLAARGAEYGLDLDGAVDEDDGGSGVLRRKPARTLGHRPEPGLLLLRDLRDLHLAAAENSLYWEMLGQAAQASKDTGLLELVSGCHPQTLRQLRWTNTMVKTQSPQILTSR